MDYYIVRFDLLHKKYYTIWFLNDDGHYLTDCGQLIYFESHVNAKDYCNSKKIRLKDDSDVDIYDVDYLTQWLKSEYKEINCSVFLDFWNTVQDMAKSIGEHFYGDENGEDNIILYVYNQLFYGTNPEAMREDGELYYPKWDNEDLKIIKNVIEDGIRIIQKALGID